MSVPAWVLLAFATWTLLTLMGTVGAYRWTRILSGRASLSEWRPDQSQGSDWYRRAMRAHANCVENLAVYAALVVVITASGVESRLLDTLAVIMIVARVCQTLTHIAWEQTDLIVGIRFSFFFVQLICMLWMGAYVGLSA